MSQQKVKQQPEKANRTRVKPSCKETNEKTAVSQSPLTGNGQRTVNAVAHLQQTVGNQAVRRLLIQPKLTVGPVGDKYEQEANAVAKQVVNQLSASNRSNVQRQEEDELEVQAKHLQRQEEDELQLKPIQRQEEDELQMKSGTAVQRQGGVGYGGGEISADLEQSIQSARGRGQPLADNVRTPMENAFSADFSGVKVHTDSQSDTLNQSIQARAFTTGQDIFFRQGEYNLGSSGGQELLAHELTHVVQQGGATVQRQDEEDTLQTKPISKQSAPVSQISRLVEYNHDIVGGRFTDAEQARGILPFTEEGWDGRQIGQQLSQLNDAVTNNDNVRCVQAAFLVSLIQQGPGALSTMINNYLNRYRVGLAQAGTPPRIKRWYRRSVRNLQPLLAKIDAKTLTYEDLSTILTEMYDIYGSGSGGTSSAAQMSMAVREGYQGTRLNKENATQEDAAAEAQALQPGEFLLCAVEVSKEGTDQANHAIHIGRYPDLGTLYLYDPWPVKGDQMIDCDESLNNAEHYFTNPLEDETTDLDSEDGLDIEIHEMRTFHILIKFTPPAEEGAE